MSRASTPQVAAAEDAPKVVQPRRASLSLRRFHSLSGAIPLALLMLVQLWSHAKLLGGTEAYQAHLERLAALPGLRIWQALLTLALLFHAGYGLLLVLRPRYRIQQYPQSRNWMYVLQRATAVATLALIVAHVVLFWLPLERGSIAPSEIHGEMVRQMSTTRAAVPWLALGYMLGLGAWSFHLAGGLWSAAMRWGVVITKSARSQLGMVLFVIGLGLFAYGANTVVYLATGWRMSAGGDGPPRQGVDDAQFCGESNDAASAAPTAVPAPSVNATATGPQP